MVKTIAPFEGEFNYLQFDPSSIDQTVMASMRTFILKLPGNILEYVVYLETVICALSS